MINFQNNSPFFAFLLTAVLLSAFAGNLQAQSLPRPLVPKAEPLAPPADMPKGEKPQALESPTSRSVVEGARIKGKMVVEGLQAIDSSSVGLISEGERGLGLQMWTGTSRRRIALLINRLPAGSTSPVLQDLFRRLILTAALIPAPGKQQITSDLLHLRLKKLFDAGLLNDVLAFAGRLQQSVLSEDTHKLLQETYWLLGHKDRACAKAAEQAQTRIEAFWVKSVLFCRALDGQHERAEMGAILLEENGEKDPVFYELLAKMADAGVEFAFEEQPVSALHMAMARATKTEIPVQLLASAGPGYLRSAAFANTYPAAFRLAAGWRAAEFGVMPVPELDSLLGDEALAQTFEGPFLLADYQLAKSSTDSETAQQALRSLVQQISQSNIFFPLCRLLGDKFSSLQPDRDNTAFLLHPARTFLALEKLETADEWLRQARRATLAGDVPSISRAQAAVGRLEPLLLIAGASEVREWDDKMFLGWRRAQADLTAAEKRRAGNILLSLLDAVGTRIPIKHWQLLADQTEEASGHKAGLVTSRTMSPAVIRSLLDAAANERVGETVSLVLSSLGNGNLTQRNPSDLLVAIGALRQIGLEREARSLAIEVALANNL